MSDAIVARDPRGIRISCSEGQWQQHIAPGHAIMSENKDAIIQTISSPDYIYESHDSTPPLDYREVFCKEVRSATYYSSGLLYTKVVVCIGGGSGEIITAYPAKNVDGGTTGEVKYCASNCN